jgi:hypothetical protein
MTRVAQDLQFVAVESVASVGGDVKDCRREGDDQQRSGLGYRLCIVLHIGNCGVNQGLSPVKTILYTATPVNRDSFYGCRKD